MNDDAPKQPFFPDAPKKRSSKVIRLCLLASVAAIAGASFFDWGASEEREAPRDFATEQECIDKTSDAALCLNAAQGAKEDHLANARKFTDLPSCEAEFGAGNCATQENPTLAATTPQSSPSSIFLPLMSGFLLSRILSNTGNNYAYGSLYRNAAGETFSGKCEQPPCNKNSSNFVGSGRPGSSFVYHGGYVNSWMGGNTATSSMSKSASGGFSRTTISRGGFGSSFHGSGG